MNRIRALDAFRGLAILYMVFGHAVVYNYAHIQTVQLDDLPWPMIAIGVVGLWGGVFLIYSLIVNTLSILRRGGDKSLGVRMILPYVYAGLAYVFVVGTLHSMVLGRWTADLPADEHNLTLVAQAIRNLPLTFNFHELLNGSGIKTAGFNLILVPLVMYALFRRRGLRNEKSVYAKLVLLGVAVILLAFGRVYMYSGWYSDVHGGNGVLAWLGSLLIANPYPGVAYAAYGFLGAALGLMYYYARIDLLRRVMLPIGAVLVALGLAVCVQQEPTILTATWFWYGKVVAETGMFVLIFAVVLAVSLRDRARPAGRGGRVHGFLAPLSRLSLTVYLGEVLTSELLRPLWQLVTPQWAESYGGIVLLGLANVLVWVAIAHVWRLANYKYSVEYWWVQAQAMFGRVSTKLKYLQK